MADDLPEGTVERPYRQNPPRIFYEVHWSSHPMFAIGGTVRDATQEGPAGVFYYRDATHWGDARMDPTTPAPGTPTDETTPRGEGLRFNRIAAMAGGKIDGKRLLIAGGFRDYITVDNLIYDGDELISWHYTNHTTATLFWSDDGGKSWTEVDCPVIDPGPAPHQALVVETLYLAFDPALEVFYGDVSKTGAEPFGGTTFHTISERHLIKSLDGKNWTIAATERRDLDVEPEAFTSPFLEKIKTIANNGLTEVIDATGTAKLTYTTVAIGPDTVGGQLQLDLPWKIEDPTHETETFTITTIPHGTGLVGLKGIAYSQGRFLVAGSLMQNDEGTDYRVFAYVSSDKGKTWTKTLEDADTFITFDPYSPPGVGCAGSCGCAGV